MEDEKLAAYYDDLTRRGGGAARFKQGLGFSSPSDDVVPPRGSALPTASSFFGGFVRASSPSKTSEFEKQAQLQSIQNKLSKNPKEKTRNRSPRRNSSHPSRSRSPSRDKHSRRRSRDRYSRRKSRSRSRDRRSRRRSRSREDESRRKYRSRSRSRERGKRNGPPENERSERGKKVRAGSGIDYSKLIAGYDNMTPADRVKAKMKAQLSETAEKDETIGKGSGWERFDFDKDAPLDDEEIEAAEDDAVLVKHMGQSFRYSTVEARKEEELKVAHDEAMFGGSSHPLRNVTNDEAQDESLKTENVESAPVISLLSNQVQTMQRGSWRDRARKS